MNIGMEYYFNNKEDWENFKHKDLIKYEITDDFFENHNIFITCMEFGTGSVKLKINKAYSIDDTLYASIGCDYPEIGTCDMVTGMYIFITDKNVTQKKFIN